MTEIKDEAARRIALLSARGLRDPGLLSVDELREISGHSLSRALQEDPSMTLGPDGVYLSLEVTNAGVNHPVAAYCRTINGCFRFPFLQEVTYGETLAFLIVPVLSGVAHAEVRIENPGATDCIVGLSMTEGGVNSAYVSQPGTPLSCQIQVINASVIRLIVTAFGEDGSESSV